MPPVAVPAAPASVNAAPGEADEDASAVFSIETADGATFRLKYRSAQIATFHYVFWGDHFDWAHPVIKNTRTSSGTTIFDLDVDGLGLKIAGKIWKTAPAELSFEYAINATRAFDNAVGGGLEFNLNLDANMPGKGNVPSLLAGARGFQWDVASPEGINVSFEPALASAFFEQNQKNTIRCFLVAKQIRPSTRVVTMRVRLPRGSAVRRSVDERYGSDDRSTWFSQMLEWDKWPVDVSYLNEKPAGKRGRVKADGERLVFQDGTPARFWGANVQAYALYQGTKEDIANQAKRIAALGYNLIRLHHHDSEWVKPNVFDLSDGTTQKLDEQALDRLDWWVKCLKDEGVYVWMDLHVGRQFLRGDRIEGYAELAKQQGSGKGFNYVNPRIEKLMQEFASKYVTRKNRYTGTPYTEEPALVGVLVTNENDLTFHHASLFAPDKGNSVHRRLFESMARPIAKRAGLPSGLKVWEPSTAKIVMTEIEHLFDKRAIERLRGEGLKSLIATTSFWGAENLYTLPPLAAGDIVDVHSYGSAESLGTNPRFEANFISWIGAVQVAGKPLSISEWNVEYPNRDRFVAPLYVAAISSLQGWDAPMIYGYAQVPIQEPDRPETWSTWIDPALTALMPAAALMFREGHVKEAQKTYRLDLTRETLYQANTNPDTSVALRTLVEQSKLTIGLPDIPELGWDDALSARGGNATAFTDTARDFIPQGQNFVTSDTGQLKRDWSIGIETIDTPQSQGAIGWLGKRLVSLREVSFDLQTPKAAAIVTSMDGKPIATSKKMLLTVVAQVATSPGDKLPFLSQPVEGTITINNAAPLRMVPLSPRANPASGSAAGKTVPIAPARKGSEQTFTLGRATATHWFLLTAG